MHKFRVPIAYIVKDFFRKNFKNQVVKTRSTYRIQVKVSLKNSLKNFLKNGCKNVFILPYTSENKLIHKKICKYSVKPFVKTQRFSPYIHEDFFSNPSRTEVNEHESYRLIPTTIINERTNT